MSSSPTPYPDINSVLSSLLADVRRILGDRLVGVYLDGSLALGDFVLGRSDIDFDVVITELLPDKVVAALFEMHQRLSANELPWGDELEGSYLPLEALRHLDQYIGASFPRVERYETLSVRRHDGGSLVNLHVLREHGVVLTGPAPKSLIDPIPPTALRAAAVEVLANWWAPMVRDPAGLTRLRDDPGYQVYAVLTMCRVPYTVRFGAVAAKSAAARWAEEELGPRWKRLIDEALAWRNGGPFDHLAETVEMIQYVADAKGAPR